MARLFADIPKPLKVLLDNGAKPNQASKNGCTALIQAARSGHSEAAKILLDNGADPNQADKYSETALMLAAVDGHSETVKVLLDNGADPNQATEKRSDGFDGRGYLADIPKPPKFCSTTAQRRIRQMKTAKRL